MKENGSSQLLSLLIRRNHLSTNGTRERSQHYSYTHTLAICHPPTPTFVYSIFHHGQAKVIATGFKQVLSLSQHFKLFLFFFFPTFAMMDSSVVVFAHVWRQLLSKKKLLESEVGSAQTLGCDGCRRKPRHQLDGCSPDRM